MDTRFQVEHKCDRFIELGNTLNCCYKPRFIQVLIKNIPHFIMYSKRDYVKMKSNMTHIVYLLYTEN